MIKIKFRDKAYGNKVYALIKAFYPNVEMRQMMVPKQVSFLALEFVDVLEPRSCQEACFSLLEKDFSTFLRVEKLVTGIEIHFSYENLTEVYDCLMLLSGYSLPWGILTGVRPTKLAYRGLERGLSLEEVIADLQNNYKVSIEKANLAVHVANREREIIRDFKTDSGFSLYVGIPFCPGICHYCSFSSGAIQDYKDKTDDYVAALCEEIIAISNVMRCDRTDRKNLAKSINEYVVENLEKEKGFKLQTIYIGGGTPSSLSVAQLQRILETIVHHFSMEHVREFTVELGRADTISKELLELLQAYSVSRISINPQSMQQKTLDRIGRNHTVAQVKEAFYLARSLGFHNINMDIIVGLPGETLTDLENTMEQVKVLAPDSITVHTLALKRGSQEAKAIQNKQSMRKEKESNEIAKMLAHCVHICQEMGLFPYYLYRQKHIKGNYENVGYAKVDKAGIYNILIMEEQQSIFAAGAGAITKLVRQEVDAKSNIYRLENVKNIDIYINTIKDIIEQKKELTLWL